MKRKLAIYAIVICLPTLLLFTRLSPSALGAQSTVDSESVKSPQRKIREEEKQRKKDEKQHRTRQANRPLHETIAAPIDTVRDLIIADFLRYEFRIDRESAHQLTFSRSLQGFAQEFIASWLVGSNTNPELFVALSLVSDADRNTLVSVDKIELHGQNVFGRTNIANFFKNKDQRAFYRDFLDEIKQKAEAK